jgi:hypothetical protein
MCVAGFTVGGVGRPRIGADRCAGPGRALRSDDFSQTAKNLRPRLSVRALPLSTNAAPDPNGAAGEGRRTPA